MSYQEDGFDWDTLDSVPAGQPRQAQVNGEPQPVRRVVTPQVARPYTTPDSPFEIIDLDGPRKQVRANTWGRPRKWCSR